MKSAILFLCIIPIWGFTTVGRIDSRKKCVELYRKQNEIIDYREYGDSCSTVCLIDGNGNKSTSIQQPNGAPCHEDVKNDAEKKNWTCFKGQCITKEALDVCVKMMGKEENLVLVIYQLCNVVCLGKDQPKYYDQFFNSSQSCFKGGKFGKCTETKTCVV